MKSSTTFQASFLWKVVTKGYIFIFISIIFLKKQTHNKVKNGCIFLLKYFDFFLWTFLLNKKQQRHKQRMELRFFAFFLFFHFFSLSLSSSTECFYNFLLFYQMFWQNWNSIACFLSIRIFAFNEYSYHHEAFLL